MKIKKIKKLRVNAHIFDVIWDKSFSGGHFSFFSDEHKAPILVIGTRDNLESEMFEVLIHELWELVACEMRVRHNRTDCEGEYVFVYDHRQHTAMCAMFTGLLYQFIQ